MDTAAIISLATFAIQEAIKEEPALAAGLQKLFTSGNPTDADFAAFRATITAENYFKFVPASAIQQ